MLPISTHKPHFCTFALIILSVHEIYADIRLQRHYGVGNLISRSESKIRSLY